MGEQNQKEIAGCSQKMSTHYLNYIYIHIYSGHKGAVLQWFTNGKLLVKHHLSAPCGHRIDLQTIRIYGTMSISDPNLIMYIWGWCLQTLPIVSTFQRAWKHHQNPCLIYSLSCGLCCYSDSKSSSWALELLSSWALLLTFLPVQNDKYIQNITDPRELWNKPTDYPLVSSNMAGKSTIWFDDFASYFNLMRVRPWYALGKTCFFGFWIVFYMFFATLVCIFLYGEFILHFEFANILQNICKFAISGYNLRKSWKTCKKH